MRRKNEPKNGGQLEGKNYVKELVWNDANNDAKNECQFRKNYVNQMVWNEALMSQKWDENERI